MIRDNLDLKEVNKFMENTMVSHLGIEVIEIGSKHLTATMPVDHRTVQPMRLLHGGASVTLAETLGNMGSTLCIDAKWQYVVGIEINANHIKSAKSGLVTGKASLLHFGRKTHVWDIKIKNEIDELVCISRLTVAVINKK